MHKSRFWKIAFVWVLPCLACVSTLLRAQEEDPPVRIIVTGNRSPALAAGDTIRIIATAKTTVPGLVRLKVQPTLPAFALDWDEKEVFLPSSGSVRDTLILAPGEADCGRHTFILSAQISSEDGFSKQDKTVILTVFPDIEPEPPFTAGLRNTLCWNPCEGLSEELVFFPVFTSPARAGEASGEGSPFGPTQRCQTVEGLLPGVRYGYFLESTVFLEGRFITLRSDIVFSTQDNRPPPPVALQRFSVSEAGAVTLNWPLRQDELGYVDRYVIWRKEADLNDQAFAVVDTLPFFPVTDIEPANYVPAPLELGQTLYVDTLESVVEFPPSLTGAAVIRTAVADRWKEGTRFLTFQLHAPSYIYIAYDKKVRPRPDWLERDFRTFRRQLVTDRNPHGLLLMRSRKVFAPGTVTLGGNFAEGSDIFLTEPRMYAVVIQPVDRTFPFAMGATLAFTDSLGPAQDLHTFHYRVDAIDAAGNLARGTISPPIILDLFGHCKPIPSGWFVFENALGLRFFRGAENLVSVSDPNAVASCIGFRQTDSLRFEAVRQNPALFGTHRDEDVGTLFFDSGWLGMDQLNPELGFRFDLLPPSKDPNFVNGQSYFYRVRAKDRHGNHSVWSDTVSAISDFFPPSDISGLTVRNRLFADFNDGCVDVSWGAATDAISGVQRYLVHRSDDGGTTFAALAVLPANQRTYCDTLSAMPENRIVHYKVAAEDGVGNRHPIETSQWQASLRALVGPTIVPDSTVLVQCGSGVPGIRGSRLPIALQRFDPAGVEGYLLVVERPSGERTRTAVPNTGQTAMVASLDGPDGLYRVRVRVFYANGDTTIFSNSITVKKKNTLVGVSDLGAVQAADGSGDVIVSWLHPDSTEIVRYRVFAWPEGEQMPVQPAAEFSGATRSWRQSFAGGLAAYQCQRYLVEAEDCFGLVSVQNPVVGQYPNPAPRFLTDSTRVGDADLTVMWERPAPRFLESDAFDAEIIVFQDSMKAVPDTAFTVFNQTALRFQPEPRHNYLFQVREVILNDLGQSCSDTFVSAWSEPLVVPFKNKPAPVAIEAQPLPVHPDSTTGRVFLSWAGYSVPTIREFAIEWSRLGSADEPFTLTVLDADTALLSGLDVTATYRFEVLAVDAFRQRSVGNDTALVSFSPRWQFTPKLEPLPSACFGDSLVLAWDWVGEDLQPAGSTFGAQRVEVELSLDPAFNFKKTTKQLDLRRQFAFHRATDYPFVTDQNNRLFLRIRAVDRWGHVSPWSSTYPQLGVEAGQFDPLPPEVVTCFVDSIQAPPLAGAGQMHVVLQWADVGDNCSGVWYYEVLRDGRLVGIDSSQTASHRFVDVRSASDSTLLTSTWRVHAVDSVGNRQPAAIGCRLPMVLAPPDSGFCVDDTTFCWGPGAASASGQVLSYTIEGARFAEFFGNPETGNVLMGPLESQCVTFSRPWEHIFWRVKTVVGALESPWSDPFFCELNPDQVTSVQPTPGAPVPEEFALEQNYPNPFNPSTTIRYAVPRLSQGVRVRIAVYNIAGQKLRELVDAEQAPGVYAVTWDGRDRFGRVVSSGVYVYKMRAGAFSTTRKMLFLK